MKPPRLLDWLLRVLLPDELGSAVSGDLSEEYVARLQGGANRFSTWVWYLRQWLGSIRHIRALRRRARRARWPFDGRAGWRDHFVQDVRYAYRGLAGRPTFTAVALGTLALGIGANAAMFSVVDGVVLKPLPYEEPDRLVRVWPDMLFPFDLQSASVYQEQTQALQEVSAFARTLLTFDGEGDPEIVRGARVMANHFAMLGARPFLGRGFMPEEGIEGSERVVILSHALWQRRYGSDATIVGRSIEITGRPHTVVGVMGPEHQPLESDWLVWVPVRVGPEAFESDAGMAVNGRLAAGASVADAQAESRRLYSEYRQLQGASVTDEELTGLRVVELRDWITGDLRFRLLVLLGAVGFVLLIASANVANLLLALGGARKRELAIRQALGAGRRRLAGQLLTEALVLALTGGLLGLGLAYGAISVGLSSMPPDLPRAHEIGLDGRVVGFTLIVSVLSAVMFGLAPALRATGARVSPALRDGSGASRGARQARLNHGLVTAEIALAVVLVAGAALMLRSLWALDQVDPGFQSDGVLTLRVSPPPAIRDQAEVVAFHDRVTAAIEAVPGVSAVGAIQFLPMRPGGWWSRFEVPERPQEQASRPSVAVRIVTPGYFASMEIPVEAGRRFSSEDQPDGEQVMLVNATLAAAAWPGEDPVGKELLLGSTEQRTLRVVGVVGDVRQSDLQTVTHPEAYLPMAQMGWRSMFFAVRMGGDAAAAAGAVRAAVWSVDDRAPISSMSPLTEVVGATKASTRFFTGLLSAFGLLALLLGTVGVYGVMSYVVSQQRREIGIRIAMGAASERVVWATLMRGMIPVGLGLTLGILGTGITGRALESVLFGVRPGDPLTLFVVTAVLGTAALVAIYVPARRASRVDPMLILREE